MVLLTHAGRSKDRHAWFTTRSHGIDKVKLNRSLTTAFAHLYRMQTAELHRPPVTEAQLRYVADGDGPQEVNGFFQVHTSTGDVPNPLWQVDGSIDLLGAMSRG